VIDRNGLVRTMRLWIYLKGQSTGWPTALRHIHARQEGCGNTGEAPSDTRGLRGRKTTGFTGTW
jgi:hypothetical protein